MRTHMRALHNATQRSTTHTTTRKPAMQQLALLEPYVALAFVVAFVHVRARVRARASVRISASLGASGVSQTVAIAAGVGGTLAFLFVVAVVAVVLLRARRTAAHSVPLAGAGPDA